MATTTADNIQIIGGVDTHQDLHTAAVVSHDGTVLGTESFSTTRAGYTPPNTGSTSTLLRVEIEVSIQTLTSCSLRSGKSQIRISTGRGGASAALTFQPAPDAVRRLGVGI